MVVTESDFQLSALIMLHTWESALHDVGYRLTAARRAVLYALEGAARPLSAAELRDLARTYHEGLGLVTVYRTLEILEQLGLVRRIHEHGACRGFAASSPGHRHAITCEKCSQAVEFDGDDVCLITSEVERKTGYQISDHWLQLTGLCPRCRKAEAPDA